jgi:hypothetical protein
MREMYEWSCSFSEAKDDVVDGCRRREIFGLIAATPARLIY